MGKQMTTATDVLSKAIETGRDVADVWHEALTALASP